MENQEIDYGEEYRELQEELIPEMASVIRNFSAVLEKGMGLRLSNPLPNIQIQYNNSSIYIDHEFRKAGIHDLQDDLVREAIRSDMQDIVYKGVKSLIDCTEIARSNGNEREIMELIEQYEQADVELWKYDYRKDLVDHIMLYFLESYYDVKKQIEEEEKNKTGDSKKYAVDDILTQDMLDEVIDTLKKLQLPENVILDAEEKWHEVLLDVIRNKEKEKERERKKKNSIESIDTEDKDSK